MLAPEGGGVFGCAVAGADVASVLSTTQQPDLPCIISSWWWFVCTLAYTQDRRLPGLLKARREAMEAR
jgi:hypothetical protein